MPRYTHALAVGMPSHAAELQSRASCSCRTCAASCVMCGRPIGGCTCQSTVMTKKCMSGLESKLISHAKRPAVSLRHLVFLRILHCRYLTTTSGHRTAAQAATSGMHGVCSPAALCEACGRLWCTLGLSHWQSAAMSSCCCREQSMRQALPCR
jgi:hypothetical protein